MNENASLLQHLSALYGPQTGRATLQQLQDLLNQYKGLIQPSSPTERSGERFLSSKDAILITYGDQLREPGINPLSSLSDFCNAHLSGLISGIHILPFYPFSSDDGFSVIDYKQVDPVLGNWEDISRLGMHFRLMFDAVVNHISVESAWFKAFLQNHPKYSRYFIVVEGDPDLSQVVRPRALPLLTTCDTVSGQKQVWTTFSVDQVDLNYQNPDVLLEIIDTLLFYVLHGAEFIRLDAIAYLWKEVGTACIHLTQTHHLIQLIRAILDATAPYVFLITETNVPHMENISYFGDGTNEAQLVYNFALPPLVLHSFYSGDASTLSKWAINELELPSNQVSFFNFLASHDGIGINPVRGILSETEIDRLLQTVLAHGGLISYKNNADGTQSPYELNISYFDALSDPQSSEPIELQVDRFVCAHAVMFSLPGVPGIYFHSLFGSRSWREGVAETARNRTINREKFWRKDIERELSNTQSLRSKVFNRIAQLLKSRSHHPAFHPYGKYSVIGLNPAIFAILRYSPDQRERVLCLHNICSETQRVDLYKNLFSSRKIQLFDLITGNLIKIDSEYFVTLQPYQILWLQLPGDDREQNNY